MNVVFAIIICFIAGMGAGLGTGFVGAGGVMLMLLILTIELLEILIIRMDYI